MPDSRSFPKIRPGAIIVLLLTLIGNRLLADGTELASIFEQVGKRHGVAAENRIRAWRNLIRASAYWSETEKLQRVNDFFNHARYMRDRDTWARDDYWATPIEFLTKDAGDCEDFSIAKYFTLKEMNVSVEKLRITYVKALELNQAHMVLAYYATPTATPIILDNIDKKIVSAAERTDLQPIYSFNVDDLWLARSKTTQLKAGKANLLGPWKDLNLRLANQQL